jgi:hypothetical protein
LFERLLGVLSQAASTVAMAARGGVDLIAVFKTDLTNLLSVSNVRREQQLCLDRCGAALRSHTWMGGAP